MRRWIPVALVLFAMGFMVRPILVRDFRVDESVDETRMFVVTEEQSVRFAIPARSSHAELQVVSVVPPEGDYTPSKEYPFRFEATLVNEAGEELFHWDLSASSRVSLERFPPLSGDRRGARLVGGDRWVTDVRLLHLPVQPFVARDDAELILRSKDFAELLVRGFAIRGEKQRLTVKGVKEEDYDLRRVRLSTYRRPFRGKEKTPSSPMPLRTGPGRSVAFNIEGGARVGFRTEGECVIGVVDGLHLGDQARRFRVFATPGVETEIDFPKQVLRTVSLSSRKPCSFQVVASPGQESVHFGENRVTKHGALSYLTPDWRRSGWIPLDEESPLPVTIEPEQSVLRVGLRRVAQPGQAAVDSPQVHATYRVLLSSGEYTDGEIDVRPSWSPYERVDRSDLPVSDAAMVLIRLPEGARRVELRGPEEVVVSLAVPTSFSDEYEEVYRAAELRRGRWYGAPREVHRWARIHPDPLADGSSRSWVTLRHQVRILPRGSRRGRLATGKKRSRTTTTEVRGPRVPNLLDPIGAHLEQRVLIRDRARPAVRHPRNGWTRIDGGRKILVAAHTGGWVTVTTKVRPASLGTRVSVRVDGKEVRTFVAATTTQRVPLRTGVGRFDVDVQGLGEGGLAYVDAAPLDGGFILQQKTASELSKGGSLTFHISEEQTTGTVLILQVSTVREGETWVAKYNLFENGDDGVEVQANGSAQGMGTRERKSMLWDIEGGEQAGYSEARIALPAPSSEGWRTLRLWLAGGTAERVWVRAVLLGKEEGGTSERVRLGRGRDSL